MRQVRAQLKQVVKTRFAWICLAVCVTILALFFCQYTFNRGSGTWDPRVGDPAVVATYFLWMFATFLAIIPAVAVGCFLGAKDFGFNTAGNVVVSGGKHGRWCALCSKLAVLSLTSVTMVIFAGAAGLAAGLVHNGGWAGAPPIHIVYQVLIAFMIVFMMHLLSFLAATISRNVALSQVICYVLLLAAGFLPGPVERIAQWINPTAYFARLLLLASPELAHVPGISVSLALPSVSLSLSIGVGVLVVEAVALTVLTSCRGAC